MYLGRSNRSGYCNPPHKRNLVDKYSFDICSLQYHALEINISELPKNYGTYARICVTLW